MEKLNAIINAWADTSCEMVLSTRKVIDDVLCMRAEECFAMGEWVEILESDGGQFEDGEKMGWVMDSVRRGLGEKSAAIVYQASYPYIVPPRLLINQITLGACIVYIVAPTRDRDGQRYVITHICYTRPSRRSADRYPPLAT